MDSRFSSVERAMLEFIDSGVFPCACAEIGDAGGAVFRKALGDRQTAPHRLPANTDTLFDMASVTKIFTVTMLCLRAFERGELAPSDTLGLFYDKLPERSARITIGSLLTHTSGIATGVSIIGEERSDIARAILNRPLGYDTGACVRYSCLGFIVLGELLERLYGEPLDALAGAGVFAPLGMTRTGYMPAGDNIAATELDDAYLGVVNDRNARYMTRPVGNAGVFSCLEDCGAFARMLLAGGEPLVSEATLLAATENLTAFSPFARGYGFFRFKQPANPACDLCSPRAFGHTGWTGVSVMADPVLKLYVVLLTNRTHVIRPYDEKLFRARRSINNAAVAAFTGRAL